MSNETMPEKIWAWDRENGKQVWIGVGEPSNDETALRCSHYTRTDTIPSRAQVAREFMDDASALYCNTDASSLWQAMLRLHAEWEEADGK